MRRQWLLRLNPKLSIISDAQIAYVSPCNGAKVPEDLGIVILNVQLIASNAKV